MDYKRYKVLLNNKYRTHIGQHFEKLNQLDLTTLTECKERLPKRLKITYCMEQGTEEQI
jgi:hypothetical protein